MTIAVACNLSDGVVMGVDSAITIEGIVQNLEGQQLSGVLKVYNDAEKLFALSDLPICIVTHGIAILGKRTMQSYIAHFEQKPKKTKMEDWEIKDVAENLWKYFSEIYKDMFEEALEQRYQKPFDEIDPKERPNLGLMVGGFSPREYLSEVWEVVVHSRNLDDGIRKIRGQGDFGSNWRGETEGVKRFHKGFSINHLDRVIGEILNYHDVKMTIDLQQKIYSILNDAEFIIPWDGMPLQEGINYVKFCLDIMINQTKFVIGAPTCGGNVRIAVVERDKVKSILDTDFEVRRI